MKPFYTLDDLRQWDVIAPTLNPPARLAVIGDPIAHSRSPQMHNAALKACGIDAQYIRVQVPAGSVAEAFGLFAKHGFIGVNCTIPHKFEALQAVHEVDSLARRLGAVNTVVIKGDQLKGYNSDGPGFLRSVQESFGKEVRDLRVLIIGAGGGAGRAVAVQCAIESCPLLVLANRSTEKLNPLCEELRGVSSSTIIQTIAWTDSDLAAVLNKVDLIVNATPIGMKPEDAPLFDMSLLKPQHLVYDMVYKAPGQSTPLIAAAKQVGAKTCDGLVLLLHQGAISFEHWFQEKTAPIEAMRRGLQN
jgi:shikimate dehydrogenase